MFIHDAITIDIVEKLNDFLLLQRPIVTNENIICKHLFEEQYLDLAGFATYLKENGCLGVKLDFIPLLDEELLETLNPKGNLLMLYFPTAIEICQVFIEDESCKVEPLHLHLSVWPKPLDFAQAKDDFKGLLEAIYTYALDNNFEKHSAYFKAALDILAQIKESKSYLDKEANIYLQAAAKAWVFDAQDDWYDLPNDNPFHEHFGSELQYIIYWMHLVGIDFSVEHYLQKTA